MQSLRNRFQKTPALYALLPLLLSALLDLAFGISYIQRYLDAVAQVLTPAIVAQTVFIGCFRTVLILICFFLCFWAISTGRIGIRYMILPAFLAAVHMISIQQEVASVVDYLQFLAAAVCLAAMIFMHVTADSKSSKGKEKAPKGTPSHSA